MMFLLLLLCHAGNFGAVPLSDIYILFPCQRGDVKLLSGGKRADRMNKFGMCVLISKNEHHRDVIMEEKKNKHNMQHFRLCHFPAFMLRAYKHKSSM
jgi:hypothetical protein